MCNLRWFFTAIAAVHVISIYFSFRNVLFFWFFVDTIAAVHVIFADASPWEKDYFRMLVVLLPVGEVLSEGKLTSHHAEDSLWHTLFWRWRTAGVFFSSVQRISVCSRLRKRVPLNNHRSGGCEFGKSTVQLERSQLDKSKWLRTYTLQCAL